MLPNFRDRRLTSASILTSAESEGVSGRRVFPVALAALALALCLSFYASYVRQSGRFRLEALLGSLALLLAGVVAVKVTPALLRRSRLQVRTFSVKYELTREGVVYFLLVGLLAIAALNTGNNLLFMILAILLGGLLMSGLISRAILSGLELQLQLPDHIFARQPVSAHLILRNLKAFSPTYSVTIFSPKRKARDGLYPLPPILTTPVYAPYIPRRSAVTENVALRFPRRGLYGQESFEVSSKFPFGILRRKRAVSGGYEILVLPSIEPRREFQELASLIQGEIEIAQKGRGGDFFALRDYQVGDSARHVDWKATAKTQKLQIREFTREEENRVTLFFDSRIGATDALSLEQFEKAISFCACLAWRFFETRSLLQFISANHQTAMSPAESIIYPILEALATLEPHFPARDGAAAWAPCSRAEAEGFPIFFFDRRVGPALPGFEGHGHVIAVDAL